MPSRYITDRENDHDWMMVTTREKRRTFLPLLG